MTCNPQIISNAMNQHFLSVAGNIVNGLSSISNNTTNSPVDYLFQTFVKPFPTIKYNDITRHDIENTIKFLKLSNSSSYDEISVKILKLSCSYVSSPLTKLCNMTLASGIFPDYLKYPEIKPFFESGNKDKMDTYRPKSILPSLSKIFKKLILHRLIQHFNDHHTLANEQFGFRQNYSPDKAIFHLLNQILNALHTKKMAGGMFCNLKKALDCVDHAILLSKLKLYGITGRMYDLIKSYLHDRYQRVVILSNCAQNIYSEWGKVSKGVPKGSILGPFLFLVYINDPLISLNRNSSPILFGDNTSIMVKNPNRHIFQTELNQVFLQLNTQFNINFLSFNLEKTHFIHFTTKNTPYMSITINDNYNTITNTSRIKFLGLTIENNLCWRTHLDLLLQKLSKVSFAIRTIKSYMSQEVLLMVYHAHFHSVICYGIIFWCNSPHSMEVFRLQKRVIQIICSIKNRDSCRDYFKQFKIHPLQSQYLFSILMFVANNINYYKFYSDIHNINTRHIIDLYQPSCLLSVFNNGIFNISIKFFNKLPSEIKILIHDIKLFKKMLKDFYYSNSFYTIHDYFNYSIK
jgi:hypothetical protein